MKNVVVTSFGIMLAIVSASPSYGQTVYQFDGGGVPADDFLVAANWDDILAGPDAVPGPLDQAIINDAFVVKYDAAVTTTLSSLIIGADWPVTGPVGTAGTLNMSAGKLIVTDGGDFFQIGRACCAGDGAMNMTGNAELQIGGSDPIVGTRENGVLDIADNAKVYNTPGKDNYWRLGNYGPSFDPFNPIGGLQGNGLLNVHDNGTFNAHVIFVGDNDSTGELRVSDNGSVVLTGNLVPRPSGAVQVAGSATIQMNGSTATLSAFNLESESLAGEIRTKYEFNAGAGGVSEIKLVDAINIGNNDLIVDLTSFALAPATSVLLFDGDQALVGNRVFGTFANLSVLGGASAPNYYVVYDQPNGDILLARTVPEPSTMLLLGLGMSIAVCAKRRASR